MNFSFSHKALKMLNKAKTTENKLEYLQGIFKQLEGIDQDFGLSEFYSELTNWFVTEANKQTVSNDVAQLLADIVDSNQTTLKGQVKGHKNVIAEFLVEVLRCINFALHDKQKIILFIEIFQNLGISIGGQPDACVLYETFEDLRYDPDNQTVMMRMLV